MDKNGVTTAVVSISMPGVWNGVVSEAVALARSCNEYTAETEVENSNLRCLQSEQIMTAAPPSAVAAARK
jgi:hypothetical protein